MALGGGGVGTGEGIIGGADNLGTAKWARTSKPVSEAVFLIELKEVFLVSRLNGIRKAYSKPVWYPGISENNKALASIKMDLVSGCGADTTAALLIKLSEKDSDTNCAWGVPSLAKNCVFLAIN